MRITAVFQVIGLALILQNVTTAQSADRFQAGVQFTGFHINQLDEGSVGIGGRIAYDLLDEGAALSLEGEFNYFPQNPSGNFGESQFLTGVKAGFASERFGLFAKLRPGFVHFAGGDFAERNHGTATDFALDAGGVLEYRLSGRTALRLAWGDTMVFFPKPVFTGSSTTPKPAGLTHNLQGSIGVMFRF